MPDPRRLLILATIAASGCLALAFAPPVSVAAFRRPADEVFAVDGWSVGDNALAAEHGVEYVTRRYAAVDDGAGAVVAIATSPDAKSIYRAGPEVPFVGAGYLVTSAAPGLLPPRADRTALVAVRGQEALLIVSTYGERRGRLGSGPTAWVAAAIDGVLARPNDYYIVTVVVPLGSTADSLTAAKADQLAVHLFDEVERWYQR